MSSGSPSPLPLAERMRRRQMGDGGAASAASGGGEGARVAARPAAPAAVSGAGAVLAPLLARLFAQPTAAGAKKFLASKACSRAQRKDLATLASLEEAWVDCDQAVPENVGDLAASLVAELYEPFWFFHSSLLGGASADQPRTLFGRGMATPPLKQTKRDKYWMASSGTVRQAWLPAADATFDAVVHFVQAGSGTGVHIGGGKVLTCAHVVDARDDDAMEEGEIPTRLGRQKLLMFASGRTFIAECVAVQESEDGSEDVAVATLGTELAVTTLPSSSYGAEAVAAGAAAVGLVGLDAPLPAAEVAEEAVALGGRLFCVGNPSNVDLESLSEGGIEFEPPTWHTSVGRCEGYMDPEVQAARDAQKARGRAPTRGELKSVADAAPVSAVAGSYLQHSCWTYWGHSGAPLFNERGEVAGLHCAWDDMTVAICIETDEFCIKNDGFCIKNGDFNANIKGMRHGQKLVSTPAVPAAT